MGQTMWNERRKVLRYRIGNGDGIGGHVIKNYVRSKKANIECKTWLKSNEVLAEYERCVEATEKGNKMTKRSDEGERSCIKGLLWN